MRLRRQRRKNSSFLAGVIAGLLISMTGMMIWWYLPGTAASPGSPLSHERGTPETASANILVLGVDEREGDTGRSDTMMLVRVAKGQVRMLSIPRDTLMDIEGYGEGKANSAYTYGGPELAMQAVSEALGLPVDHYVKVNTAGFRELVDILGGVEFDVPKAMSYYDPTDGLRIDLEPGLQVLDGDKAEQFVRFRSDGVGDDVGRIHRQQEFLKAAVKQAVTPANLTRLPQLIATARQHVDTDLPLSTQMKLAYTLYKAEEKGAVVQETVPGHGDYVDGISFFLIDEPQLKDLVASWQ